MDSGRRNPIKTLFVPQYNELVLFLMSISFLLVIFSYSGLRSYAYHFVFDNFDIRGFLFLMIPVLGIIVSIAHVFTQRKINDFEKIFMLFFAVVANAFAGIAAGIHQLFDNQGWLIIFPLWNIVNAGLLLLMYIYKIIDESYIIDDKPTHLQTTIGFVVVTATFLIDHYFLKYYWAITLSMCFTYACNINSVVQHISPRAKKSTI